MCISLICGGYICLFFFLVCAQKSALSFPDLAELASRIELPARPAAGEDDVDCEATSSPEHEAKMCSYSNSLVFSQEMLGYSSDLSDDDGAVSADEATHLTGKLLSESPRLSRQVCRCVCMCLRGGHGDLRAKIASSDFLASNLEECKGATL